ncbi:MAG: sporadic carbohydrate cluster protein, TIGR04323 family [Azospirillaceae bacterium]|nr:sporadic carbohydrate cluster protein, TIGR04323 family [Azospirillaceae bacterium]
MSEEPFTRHGYRGYVGARPVFGNRAPQAVQNLVIRDYAARNKLAYKLSATEYAMPACYIMLHQVLAELPRLEGVILYSLFMLPQRRERRRAVYQTVLDQGAVLHTAVEGMVLREAADIGRLEDVWLVQQAMVRAGPTLNLSHPIA